GPMDIRQLSPTFSVSAQLTPTDVARLQAAGTRTLVCNRPDGEGGAEQPAWQEIEQAAAAAGIKTHYLPVVQDTINSADVRRFAALLQGDESLHAFCRSGARSTTLWALARIHLGEKPEAVVASARDAGVDLATLPARFASVIAELDGSLEARPVQRHCPVLIIGGGAAGIALASSLLKRAPGLQISIVEPSDEHWYQPGFTLVGGGIFEAARTRRSEASVMPAQVNWIKGAVTHILPERNEVVLAADSKLSYERLVICPGLKLNWA